MKGVVFDGLRSTRIETLPDPEISGPTDAIVRVGLTAICGSDLHVYHEREEGCDHGTVMGHEFIGEIVETGSDVGDLRRGMSVVSPFTTSCGACFYCKRGLTARCRSGQLYGWRAGGRGLHGAQAEYVRVPLASSTLVPIPDGVEREEALLLGDVLSTGYFCAKNARVGAGDTCVVVGSGPVGLMAIVGARELGVERVYAVDSIPERLELAGTYGARTIDRLEQDPVEALAEATEGRGADAVLEAVGSPAAGRLAVELVRPGGTISVVGVHNEADFSFSPTEAYDKNLTFTVGRCPARAVLEELIPMVRRKEYNLTAVISHRLPLDQGPRGYEIFDRKEDRCTKVVLEP